MLDSLVPGVISYIVLHLISKILNSMSGWELWVDVIIAYMEDMPKPNSLIQSSMKSSSECIETNQQ